MKKDLPAIAVAHRVSYVATASVAYPHDIQAKVKRAMKIKGPKYLQVHVPCPLGWGLDPKLTVEIARLAVETGLYPLFEIENGQRARVKNVPKRKPVEEYLRPQARYRHLFKMDGGAEQIEQIQAIADANAVKYGLGPVEAAVVAQAG